MKFSVINVFFMSLILTFGTSSLLAQDAGSYTKAEADDSEVVAAANFAMKARQNELRKTDKDANVSLTEIFSAKKQVVAGINYKILLNVNINDKNQTVEIVVWKKLSDEYSLTSWKHKTEKSKDSGE